MKKENNKSGIYLVIAICTILLSAVTVGSSIIVSSYTGARYERYLQTMKVGYIADETVYVFTSVDVVDQDATNEMREKASGSVNPFFTFSDSDSETILNNFNQFKSYTENAGSRMMAVAYDVIYKIIDRGYYSEDEINDVKKLGYTRINTINHPGEDSELEELVDLSNVLCRSNIDDFILSSIDGYSDYLSSGDVMTILSIVKYCLVENVHYDSVITSYYKEYASSQVLPVVNSYFKGDVIIPVDTVIKEDQIRTLEILAENATVTISDFYGDILLMLIGFLATTIAFFNIAKSISNHPVSFLNISTGGILFVFIISTVLILKYSVRLPYSTVIFYPVCLAPMLITSLSGKRRLGVLTSAMVGLGMTIAPGATIYTFFYALSIGCSCSYMVRFLNKRLDSIYQFALSILSTAGITAFFVILQANAIENILILVVISAIRTAITNLIVISSVPILERVLNLPTAFRLHELAYTDSPLLVRLSQVAPGTYSHSRQVADLAEAAAEEVGANAAVAKVGGLYHDIGKMDHPEYFVENQVGTSKHEELNPTLSASIIRNHVKSGADKGREAGLPSEIIDIIANHHGNDVIRYFYHEAVVDKESNRAVEEQDFRYNAEPPSSKECAIVMIADSVEAAARTIVEPTPAKFSKLIRQIILHKIENNQLDNCDLSVKDLDKISKSFLKTLTALYHSRIEYPDEDED
ncbi:MAG: HDIG domain-containing protein [Sphaerochaetaceae bacterium]|nr:HDIG domain-containing protein [Sphaerochaetaceae bacterium]